jgi:hypothetical protein
MDWDAAAVYDATGERVGDDVLTQAEAEWELVTRRVEKLQDKGNADSPLSRGIERAVSELKASGRLHALLDERLLHLFKSETYDLDYAAFLPDTSLWYFDCDRISEGDHVPLGGLGNLLWSAVGFTPPLAAAATSPTSELKLSHVVSRVSIVEPDSGLLQVESSGGTFVCRHCVVTAPLGVLQSGRLSFEPQLPPSFAQSLGESGMGVLNKSILLFDEVFWDADASVLCCLGPPCRPLGWFFNDYKYSGRKALVYLTGGDDGRRCEADTDEERTQHVMGHLETMYGERCKPPSDVHHTRWWADPMSMGSYSYRRVGFNPAHGFKGFQTPYYNGRLFFAGEHTSKDYSSTVHGAIESGRRAADQVLRAY